MSHRKPTLIAAAVVVAAALLIAPYVVQSPVAITLGQEQAPEAPADEPARSGRPAGTT